MPRPKPSLILLLAAVFPLLATANQPSLSVSLSDNHSSTFQIGERIPLQISFTGPTEKRFEMTNASYDRSGRMSYEHFDVSPKTGSSDPLAKYFDSQYLIEGGGLFNLAVLAPTPYIMHLDLNEWIRFDQPGSYTVTVTTHRVSDHSHPDSALSLQSNPIHLTIVAASPAWQNAKLAEILSKLPKDKAAIADLRYLGTPAAAQVMAQHLREDEPDMLYQCAFGLIGLPDSAQPSAIAAMNKQLADPDFPISSWFLHTLSVLPVAAGDKPENQIAERAHLWDLAWQSSLNALPQKKGPARGKTIETLLNFAPAETSQANKDLLNNALKAIFADLPADEEASILANHWDAIASPSLLPTLQQLVRKSPDQFKSIALRCWFELDPVAAREEALRQIGSTHPTLTAESLFFLGPRRLLEFDALWAKGFIDAANDYQQQSVLASLLAHYGTGDAVPIIRQEAESKVGEWACAPQAAALGYLVKFDPAGARPLVERAIQARANTACNHSVFSDITRYANAPMLRDLALEAIHDLDPEVATDAVLYLEAYGAAADETPLINRYAEWSQKWHDRAAELEHREAGSLTGNWEEINLGAKLASALIANQGWIPSEKLIQSAIAQCAGMQMCQQVTQLAATARSRRYSILIFQQDENTTFQLAQYQIKSFALLDAKIAQFPRGTEFVLPANDQAAKVKEILQKHAMSVIEAN